jgi:hypothetical protein
MAALVVSRKGSQCSLSEPQRHALEVAASAEDGRVYRKRDGHGDASSVTLMNLSARGREYLTLAWGHNPRTGRREIQFGVITSQGRAIIR